jgi:hypothetical protein
MVSGETKGLVELSERVSEEREPSTIAIRNQSRRHRRQ